MGNMKGGAEVTSLRHPWQYEVSHILPCWVSFPIPSSASTKEAAKPGWFIVPLPRLPLSLGKNANG